MDPACGTAGFLISAYKHILAANINEDGSSVLTPDHKRTFGRPTSRGTTSRPIWCAWSLVNMYLHGFVEPQIFEYDTLTSEERWNE